MTEPTPDDATTEPEAEETPEPFANRAARRAAKGKGSGGNVVGSDAQRSARSSSVQSPRQYGNRRSG